MSQRNSLRQPMPIGGTGVRSGRNRPDGEPLECSSGRCTAPLQTKFEFPIPLCNRHIVKVISASVRIDQEARQRFILENGGAVVTTPGVKKSSQSHGGLVYYMKFGDRIKIGFTTNLLQRLTAIPHDEVLAVEPGGLDQERARHEQFASARLVGEWFAMTPELLEHISKLKAKAA